MSKKRREKGDELNGPRETGGLAETNCGLILGDLIVTRSWTVVVVAILLLSMFIRVAIGLGGYSGIQYVKLSDCRRRSSTDVWRL